MKTQTEIRIPYELLTPEQKGEICNGCGAKGCWVRPPVAVFYKASCNHHDYGYWQGVTEKDRKNSDKELKRNMKKDCGRLPWWRYALYRPWCQLYYHAVRLGGKPAFYWGAKKRWPVPTAEQLILIKGL